MQAQNIERSLSFISDRFRKSNDRLKLVFGAHSWHYQPVHVAEHETKQ